MSKISLIIQREYLTRVKKKSFIIMTFLAPLLMAAVVITPIMLTKSAKDDTEKKIAVLDNTGLYANVLHDTLGIRFVYPQNSPAADKATLESGSYYAMLQIKSDLIENPDGLYIFSEKQIPIEITSQIEKQFEKHLLREKKIRSNIPNIDEILNSLKTNISISAIKFDKEGKAKKSSVDMAVALAFIGSFLIYLFIFLYGAQVMRGVIEEKVSRIVEVMVSSVRPFELMMGKVIGIALVGLTQFLMWVILSVTLITVGQMVLLKDISPEMQQQMTTGMAMQSPAGEVMAQQDVPQAVKIFGAINSFDFTEFTIFFILYFLGGFLLYGAVFAAIGSAVDNETDTQQFMMPITLPLIFAIYVAISAVNNPHGPVAFWASIFPLTSPIVMMVRIPFDVPVWEKLLSVGLLIASFTGTIWAAAKIYRTGILMYGKKADYKEIWKWLKYKN